MSSPVRDHICWILRSLAIVAMLVFSTGALFAETAEQTTPAISADSPVVAKCKSDLAKRHKIPVEEIKVVDVRPTTWPNAALGMPEIGKMYAQVLTPGARVVLEACEVRYLYTTSTEICKYGGPLRSWSASMLFLMPVKDEPNLNSDLYQSSLIGTHGIRLAAGVSDYYPQERGIVIIKRRTSRSSHDLLYLKASEPEKVTKLYQAFDLGDAALNTTQDHWAGLVRPQVGAAWTLVVSPFAEDSSKAVKLPLPEGVRSGRVAWSGEKVMIMVGESDRPTAYEIIPTDKSPVWKRVYAHTFPGQDAYLLNKSETLEVVQVKSDDKQAVEVSRVWFTGDRNVVAKISDFVMQGNQVLGRYAFVWGKKGSRPAAYSVDIGSGEMLESLPGQESTHIKPFAFPPKVYL